MPEGRHIRHLADGSSNRVVEQQLTRVRKRRRRVPRPLVIFTVALLAIFSAFAVALLAWVGSIQQSMDLGDEAPSVHDALSSPSSDEGGAFYVLIVGSDTRERGSVGRGDVMMLARVDVDASTVHLVSIPRDTMVQIEGVAGTRKINASYAYGGAAMAVRTVSEFAGVPISHYVEVDFDGLMEVVDVLGGVWVNVPEAFTTTSGMSFAAGEQLLDGEHALVYARERYHVSGGDFGRAQAQRQIVMAVIRQILDSSPAEMPALIGEVASSVSTDWRVTDLVPMALAMREGSLTVYSAVCPSYALWEDGVSYVAPMFAEWQEMMRRVDAGLDPDDHDAAIPDPQASDPSLGSASNCPAPRDYEDLASSSMTTDDVAQSGD